MAAGRRRAARVARHVHPAADAPQVRPREGEPPATCTIVGTPGDDLLRGTPYADVICGLGGHDRISAAGGDDLIAAARGTTASGR